MTERHPTPRDAAEHAVDGELKNHAADVLLDREDFCFQLLGLDSESRAVYYAADDGHVVRYVFTDECELEQDANTFIGPELENGPESVDPHGTAFAYLTTHGEDWTWTHPRFRWMVDELDELTREQTA